MNFAGCGRVLFFQSTIGKLAVALVHEKEVQILAERPTSFGVGYELSQVARWDVVQDFRDFEF